jgi:hypothetical protein
MKIIIESPEGPRPGAEPYGGIHDATSMVKALLITLAVECTRGNVRVLLDIDLDDVRPDTLVEIAKSVRKSAGGAGYAN